MNINFNDWDYFEKIDRKLKVGDIVKLKNNIIQYHMFRKYSNRQMVGKNLFENKKCLHKVSEIKTTNNILVFKINGKWPWYFASEWEICE